MTSTAFWFVWIICIAVKQNRSEASSNNLQNMSSTVLQSSLRLDGTSTFFFQVSSSTPLTFSSPSSEELTFFTNGTETRTSTTTGSFFKFLLTSVKDSVVDTTSVSSFSAEKTPTQHISSSLQQPIGNITPTSSVLRITSTQVFSSSVVDTSNVNLTRKSSEWMTATTSRHSSKSLESSTMIYVDSSIKTRTPIIVATSNVNLTQKSSEWMTATTSRHFSKSLESSTMIYVDSSIKTRTPTIVTTVHETSLNTILSSIFPTNAVSKVFLMNQTTLTGKVSFTRASISLTTNRINNTYTYLKPSSSSFATILGSINTTQKTTSGEISDDNKKYYIVSATVAALVIVVLIVGILIKSRCQKKKKRKRKESQAGLTNSAYMKSFQNLSSVEENKSNNTLQMMRLNSKKQLTDWHERQLSPKNSEDYSSLNAKDVKGEDYAALSTYKNPDENNVFENDTSTPNNPDKVESGPDYVELEPDYAETVPEKSGTDES